MRLEQAIERANEFAEVNGRSAGFEYLKGYLDGIIGIECQNENLGLDLAASFCYNKRYNEQGEKMLTCEYIWSDKADALGIEQFDDRIWDEEESSGLASILTSGLINSCKICWMRRTNGYVQFLTPRRD